MRNETVDFKQFLKNAFIPYSPNPGANLTAIITLVGIGLLGVSALLQQMGLGTMPPEIVEIGKAAFYTGMGRATMPAKSG